MEVECQSPKADRAVTYKQRVPSGAGQVISQIGRNPLDRLEVEIGVAEVHFAVIDGISGYIRHPAGQCARRGGSSHVTDVGRREDIVVVVTELQTESLLWIQHQRKTIVPVVLAVQDLGLVVATLQNIYRACEVHPMARLVAHPRLIPLQVARRNTREDIVGGIQLQIEVCPESVRRARGKPE